jgi:hypothetical protein
LNDRQSRLTTGVRYGVIGGVLLVLAVRQLTQYRYSAEAWANIKYSDDNYTEEDRLGRQLPVILRPDQVLWTLGEDNPLYFVSKHSPPTGLLYLDPLIFGDEKPAYWRQLMSDLDRTPPDLVVVSKVWLQLIPPDAPVFPWLRQHYQPWHTAIGQPTYLMFGRRRDD